jgi:hypothetical protein
VSRTQQFLAAPTSLNDHSLAPAIDEHGGELLTIVGGGGDHPQLVFTDSNDVSGVQLPPAARLSISVHQHWLGREECLDLGTTVDHSRKLEQLAEPDHLTSNQHVAHGRQS